MPEPQDFINQSRTVGKSDSAIYQELKAAGWTGEQLGDYFPTLTAPKVATSKINAVPETVTKARSASKRWPAIIGSVVVLILVSAIGYAAYQYWLEMNTPSEPVQKVVENSATPSAQLATDFSAQKASTSAVIVYSVTDSSSQDIKVLSFDLNASASGELHSVSASDSAVLNPGFWSPDGRYLPITIAATQPQMLFVDKYQGKAQRYQAELSNPWEIVPEFVAYWSSGTTAVIDERSLTNSDQVKRTEISLAGQPTTSESLRRIKYGGEDYTLDFGEVGSTSADLVLTTSQVPVTLIADEDFSKSPKLIPVGVTDEAAWFYKIEAAPVSDEFNRPATESATLGEGVLSANQDETTASFEQVETSIADASAVNSTSSGVLGVTTPTGFQTHLYGYDTAGKGLAYEDEIISTPGWLTAGVLINPVTEDFYIVEYQELDDTGNGLMQVVKFSSLDVNSQREVLVESAVQTKSLAEYPDVPMQYNFTADGKWFVYKSLNPQTGQEQIWAYSLVSGKKETVCASYCGWVSVYNPESPAVR